MWPPPSSQVVGHTIQEAGINSACGGKVLRIDVGLSRGCGDGDPQVLEILDDRLVRRLSEVQQENAAPVEQASEAAAAAAGKKADAAVAAAAAALRGTQPSQHGLAAARTH